MTKDESLEALAKEFEERPDAGTRNGNVADRLRAILQAEEPRGKGCHVCRCGGNVLCKCQCHWKTADEVLAKLDEQVKANEEAIRSDERRKIAESEDVPVTETCPRCFLSYTSFRKQAEEPRGDGLDIGPLHFINGKGFYESSRVNSYLAHLPITSPARTEGLRETLIKMLDGHMGCIYWDTLAITNSELVDILLATHPPQQAPLDACVCHFENGEKVWHNPKCPHHPKQGETHGICPECLEKELAKIRPLCIEGRKTMRGRKEEPADDSSVSGRRLFTTAPLNQEEDRGEKDS